MKPILYAPDETNFTSNGLGALSDAISVIVEEERNGKFELAIKYPFDGIHFSDVKHSSIIKAKPHDNDIRGAYQLSVKLYTAHAVHGV